MNTIVDQVDETMTTVIRGYHRLTKSVLNSQEQIDKALDAILDYSHKMEKRTSEIQGMNDIIQKLTWISTPLDPEDMEAIEIIITSCRKLLTDVLIKEKEALEASLLKHLPNIINPFMEEVDNLEENIEDLHEIFFEIPKDEEFQRLNQLLADC